MNIADRVNQATTATSTATITLGAASTGFRTFADAFEVGATLIPVSVDDGAGKWENGYYTLTSANTLTRTAITDSSNAGAAVAFSAGSKTVSCVLTGQVLLDMLDEVRDEIVEGVPGPSGVTDIPFALAVPLTFAGDAYMPDQTVTGPMAFSIAPGAVRGALAYVNLRADGVNVPTFASDILEWGGSLGYVNTAGIDNQLQFFCDGTRKFRSISQAVGAVPVVVDVTAPTLSSPTGTQTGTTTASGTVTTNEANGTLYHLATTNASETAATVKTSGGTQAITTTGSKTVNVTGLTAATLYYMHYVHRGAAGYDSTVSTSASFTTAASATAPGAPTIGTATGGDTTASIAFTAPASNGGSAITGYTVTSSPGGLTGTGASSPISVTGLTNGVAYTFTATATNAIGTGAASAASNSVTPAVAAPSPRLTGLISTTESGTGPYTYTGTGGAFSSTIGGHMTTTLAAGVDGWVEFIVNTPNEVFAGFNISSGTQAWGNIRFGMYVTGAGPTTYKRISVGSNATTTAGTVPAAGDILRIARVGNSLKIQCARAATPTTFIDMETTNYGSSPQMWAQFIVTNTSAITLRASSGFA